MFSTDNEIFTMLHIIMWKLCKLKGLNLHANMEGFRRASQKTILTGYLLAIPKIILES